MMAHKMTLTCGPSCLRNLTFEVKPEKYLKILNGLIKTVFFQYKLLIYLIETCWLLYMLWLLDQMLAQTTTEKFEKKNEVEFNISARLRVKLPVKSHIMDSYSERSSYNGQCNIIVYVTGRTYRDLSQLRSQTVWKF